MKYLDYDVVKDTVDSFLINSDRMFCFIISDYRTGKTSSLHRYHHEHTITVMIPFPLPLSKQFQEFNRSLLRAFRIPDMPLRSDKLRERTLTALRQMDTKLIIVDNFSHIEYARQPELFVSYLKMLGEFESLKFVFAATHIDQVPASMRDWSQIHDFQLSQMLGS